MRNPEHFRNKKITVVGLAKSGVACAELLSSLGAEVSVTELKDNADLRQIVQGLQKKNIKVELGGHTEEFVRGRDLVIVSPGVPFNAGPALLAEEYKIPVISEIEAGWMLCPGTVIAVTGSSGKTTVTTLIAQALQAAGIKAFILGNIGDPFIGRVKDISPADFVSLEVSSFQLERIRDFRPKIAVLLNLGRNHLDRHQDMEEYLSAKKRIFMNQGKTDFLVYNQQDETIKNAVVQARSRPVPFSGSKDLNPNAAAIIEVGKLLGIDQKMILDVLMNFKGLPHRMEQVDGPDGVCFINDSKATTAESTIWALDNIAGQVILIAGGKDKGVDYGSIRAAARDKVKLAVVIGEAASRIKSAVGGFLQVAEAASLDEAVNKAYAAAHTGDCVLLSPMCSSFDMFSGYQERGECFKKAVAAL